MLPFIENMLDDFIADLGWLNDIYDVDYEERGGSIVVKSANYHDQTFSMLEVLAWVYRKQTKE